MILNHSQTSLVAQMVQNLPAMQETQVQALDWEDPLEKEMATHSSIVESRKCMFLGSLSRHNKDLERQTLKPSVRHSSRVLDKLYYSS